MDGYARDEMADEYDALNDPRQVMMEVVGLVRDLQQAANKLGDAIVAAGLSAREWRSPDAQLIILSDQFPDITVDELITRLAEFSAGLGPAWLRGGPVEIARFGEEVEILNSVVRTLRVVAQRLRMRPARARGDRLLERALGDARIGTPLDLVVGALRDLESLLPYLTPLTAEQWNPPAPVRTLSYPNNTPDPALLTSPSEIQKQTFTRLRDFAEPQAAARGAALAPREIRPTSSLVDIRARLLAWFKTHAQMLLIKKWIVMTVAIVTLAIGTLLLSMLVRVGNSGSTIQVPTSRLVTSPTHASFACSGKGATVRLALRNTGSTQLAWSIKTPVGLNLSSTHGTLKPGTTVILQVRVTSARAVLGTMTFTSTTGLARVPYTVKCS